MLHRVLQRLLRDLEQRRSDPRIHTQRRVHVHPQRPAVARLTRSASRSERARNPARSTAEGFSS